jgi:SP family general alpha glucoside:H+ symporter-like MFS transporter
MMLGWATVYQLTVGTICYSIVGEIPSRQLLVKTIALGRNAYNVVGIVCSVLTPYMVNPTAWNWQQLTAFFWAGICFCCIIYTFFRIPETKGRSFAELGESNALHLTLTALEHRADCLSTSRADLLFEHRVSARRFASTDLDVFDTNEAKAAARAVEMGEDKDLPVHVEKTARVC